MLESTWLVKQLIKSMGENPDRAGLEKTPDRVVNSWKELFSGYKTDIKDLFTVFDNEMKYDEMIILAGIEFTSFCEHHLLPFSGVAHVGYVPRVQVDNSHEKCSIIGVSKLARLVEAFSRRLQIQERITIQITDALEEYLKPLGAACVLEAKHQCVSCRGVKKNAVMVTSSMTGCFRESTDARSEFLRLIGKV